MSQWYWKVLALKAVFVFTCFATYIRADDNVQQLPFCNPHNANGDPVNNDLVIVSTLDGRLTAFSAENGNKAWDLETKPLLSSNLHHVELTSGGKWVRLVPSLRGTLFSLSGDTIEPLPFDAEQLLSSSFKYSDDLVIAGARESFWLGVDASTGSVIYECGSTGCSSEQETAGDGKDIIVLRRHSNTVRAVDPRSGAEKWNFSVAEHNLALSRRECAGGSKGPSAPAVAVGVALPEGVVAVRRPGDSRILWRQKLDAPVAGMWRLQDGALQNIDVLWEATQSLMEGPAPMTPPSLYIGVHDRQLYIQESILYTQKRDTAVSSKPLPWKVRHSRPLLDSNGQQTALSLQDADPNTLSLITLYGNTEPAGNHGFFLYLQDTCDSSVQVTPDDFGPEIIQPFEGEDNEHHHIHVHVSSLTYWWKEVLLIAATTALLTNLVWPRFRASTLVPATPLPVLQKESIVPERYYEVPSVPPQKTEEYCSRYLNDFTPIKCLGSGGFGVVFEARNKIDHCSYAVKRITLPRKEEKRTRVMREVRALATLEHDNIVRYFNSWVEEPPPNWQQKMDKVLLSDLSGHDILSTSQLTKTYKHDTKLDMHKCTESMHKRQRSNSYNLSHSVVDTQGLSDIKEPFNSHISLPSLPKNKNEDDEDSIVFFNSQYGEQSESRRESSHDKRLERVKDMHNLDGSSVESPTRSKKKKGHRRHWSLDQCVIKNVTEKYLYIQMQLCLPESLDGWLRNHHTLESRGDVVKIFSQIVAAVEYVHLVGLIHRDLKPSNIFFAPDCRIKVGDFGLVTSMSDNSKDGDSPVVMDSSGPHTYKVGTHTYMSPEQLSGRPYNYKVDIYSLGLILYELLHPFATDMEKYKHLKEARSAIYPPKFCETRPLETEVLKLMLSEDPDKRPTAIGVKARAPLFQETDEQWHFTLPPSNTLTDYLKNRISVAT